MQKLDMLTPDIIQANIEALAKLFPNIITETENADGTITKAIDYDLFRQMFSSTLVEGGEERYRLDWPGKRASILKANTPISKTLRPVVADSVNWDTTENLYIEGDNFEVLKVLQESYLGKVKMIYIDPPYNTGKDFVYTDNFKVSKDEYEEGLEIVDEEGGRLVKNTDTNGRFHSDWLSMMYERLSVARDLLREDGAIFISIGVEELVNLRKVCDTVFGEENFIEIFSWVKTSTPPALSTKSRKTNEYILCYEKNINNIKYNGEALDGGDQPLLNSGNSNRILKFPKDKLQFKLPNGILGKGQPDRVRLVEDIDIVNGYSTTDVLLEGEFKWTQEFTDQEIKNGTTFIIKSDKLSVRFIRDEEGFKRPTNFIKDKYTSPLINKPENGVGTNETASNECFDLMGGNVFDNPKPVSLIKYLSSFILGPQDLILDFFSGSATTAHAVMQLNAEDGGNRKFIMVQIPEETDKESEAYKAGYANICEIGKERIRRAGKKIVEENKDKEGIENLDTGFRVYRLDTSNMKDVYYHPTEVSQDRLFEMESNIKPDRTPEDILAQVMLDLGLTLDLPIEKRVIYGSTVYYVALNSLVTCFDEHVDFSLVDEIASVRPLRVVFRDSSFSTDADRINFETRFAKLSPETDIRVI